MSRLIFLDIDGVLNGHDFCDGAQSNTIRPSCIAALNLILAQTEPKIVLSSAWRYMVHGKAMTTGGFEYMLRTHGTVGIVGKIIGVTCRDEHCPHCEHKHTRREPPGVDSEGYRVCVKCSKRGTRGDQITRWLKDNEAFHQRYVVIDDEDYGIKAAGHPLVLTNGACGLTEKNARKTIRLLKRREV